MPQEERRKHKRLKRQFVISYRDYNNPKESYEITQIKDISVGGMYFITSREYPVNTTLNINLKTPSIAESIKLTAKVVESKEVFKDLIYDTRVCFIDLEGDKQDLLKKTIDLFLKKEEEGK